MKILASLFFIVVAASPAFSETYIGVININNSSTNGNCTKGNGKVLVEERSLPAFNEIVVSGAFTVSIDCGRPEKAILEVDGNILPLIQTTVKTNTLHIEHSSSICVENPIKISLTSPEIVKISSEGTNEIAMNCSTGYDHLSLVLTGTSTFKLQAKGRFLEATLEDATELDAQSGMVSVAHVTASGSSTAVVSVQKELVAKSSDASEIYYDTSSARIEKTISDAGEILPVSEK